jgi:excisionase family DNA binding protein
MIKKNPSNKPLPVRADGTSSPAMRLATVREACAYGRFGHTKCYDYINEGKITAYKRGKRTMIDLDSIDAFNASLQRITPRAAIAAE